MNNKPSDQAAQIIAALAERWPQCFTISKAERRPLKIGVARDIIAAGGITRGDIGRALRSYTSVEGYLESCKAGAARIDLDGNVAGSVSEAHALRAEQSLAARKRQREAPRRLSLADLRAATRARRTTVIDAA